MRKSAEDLAEGIKNMLSSRGFQVGVGVGVGFFGGKYIIVNLFQAMDKGDEERLKTLVRQEITRYEQMYNSNRVAMLNPQ
ncbi:unnamed protein product [Darwinula stevensoni]|uniref:Uncharacterized protein n=1 Tax=Darwinula stevensoni TaxID=69355 RepID=A0A7R9FPG8_9CRUS|nr:unnamed protein product [Darwinula stevensoni]CAG0897597.1 unnamed protein product [Darwinula stevensoni]